MDKFANLPAVRPKEVFTQLAMQLGDVDFTIAEKDFWVCWTLKALFALGENHPRLVFKGGTSLSKAHRLIRRFSEDIDVVTATEFFLAQGLKDPATAETRSETNRRMETLDKVCAVYIADQLLPSLQRLFTLRLTNGEAWELMVDPDDKYGHTLLFRYPWSAPDQQDDYIRGFVKIELGWRSVDEPTVSKIVKPYIAEFFPNLLTDPDFTSTVLLAERTFWEKVTALHAENSRDRVPRFFSRHYYDVVLLAESEAGVRALVDLEMLEAVRLFKERYYYMDLGRFGGHKVKPLRGGEGVFNDQTTQVYPRGKD